MKFIIKVWRQDGPNEKGRIQDYTLNDVSSDMSFLEMIDMLNEQLFTVMSTK